KQALEMTKPPPNKTHNAEAIAEVRRAAGEHYLSTNRRDCAQKAMKLFGEARNLLAGGHTPARGPLTVELGLSPVERGGDAEEARDLRRQTWEKAREEVKSTLRAITIPEAKLLGAREVSRKLIARKQIPIAAGVITQGVFQIDSKEDLFLEAQAILGL